MPTQALLPFVESPEGLTQDSLSSKSANIPGSGSSMTPHATYPSKTAAQCGANDSPSCMFCDETFSHQEEVGHHVLTQHPTTFFEPAVLRIEAEFRIPGQRTRSKPSSSVLDKEEVHTCIVCGLVSQDASELETHLRKHKDYFTYCCNVCGRRFREPWFLKNHMKMHGKSGAKSKALQDQEGPVTVNGVIQEPVSEPVVTAYKMCMVCGFFFPDHSSLVEHSKVHNRELGPDKGGDSESSGTATESMTQQSFFQSLNLKPCLTGKSLQPERTSKWIPQLDPYNTFQAWQLATRGKIAVGPITMKEMASTDNEDCSSDKEQMSSSWSDSQGDKNIKEVLGRELRSQQQAVAAILEPQLPQRRSLMQKNKEIDRPTTCNECQRSFKTYHQLVLHSRVHKREGGGEERPTVPAEGTLSRTASAAYMDNGAEEGFETGEDSFYHSKERSKHCSFCGKSFRSSYYLTVHLRTHTGEKPYKCVYCDYAAAQRTSLKYHLERRHKDKPYVEIPSKPDIPLPSPSDRKGNSSMKRSKLWLPVATGELQDKSQSRGGELDKVAVQNDDEHEKVIANRAFNATENVTIKSPVAVHLKVEKEKIKDENCEAPINLSLKVCLSVPASAQTRNASIPSVCSFCTYKTIYPEVLIMHKRLTHKDKCGGARKNTYGKQRRLTGCPPALLGKDVTPLPMIDRRHPRRTKSPPPQPTKPNEMMPANLPHAPKAIHAPLYVGPHERKRFRHNGESQSDQESAHLIGQVRKSSVAGMYQTKQPTTFTKVAAAERSFPERSAAKWQSDAAHLLLSSQFGSLPQIGEPSSKRLKQILPVGGVDIGFRGPPPGDGRIRLRLQGSGVQGMSEGSHPPADILAPLKSTAIGGGLDTDWNMMNLLRACTPNNLASLYHGVPANQNHVGLAHPRAGARSVLFQHLPTLPILPRRESPAPVSEQHSGTSDNTT
ncbi:zinc finger protein 217 [Hippocampus comes]|uniref:Zinc finger protein 217 n=1 Tax=Hippocampus comes TaxID=109280 RepID=A0A3Q2YS43_HIPCM|nr:PREDICTED: zinc finger protein 217 [Hippocampus comes]XP_019721518.1 PREDICTED: zinc finger protein 217 [Hippocampus comes]XP_019721526.1 PREDICTED: zinc finger protein 217 [Hippocampus comes]XP_019721534.1 PREDICTED: zinc finger protein 217 [Hippocampus comes]